MRKIVALSLALFFTASTFYSCQDQDDVINRQPNEVHDFIWKGMNQYYLWQENVPDLADNRFKNQDELNLYLSKFNDPFDLFDNLLYNPSVDRFSWMVDDYTVLEQSFQGITTDNGIQFGLSYKPNSTTEIFGYVRYIVPNSPASGKEIKRGDIFYGINGTQLTVSNYQSLLNLESYTLNLANIENATIVPNGKTVALTKTVVSENPILIHKVITQNNHKIGYLMYNSFISEYDTDLNTIFGEFKTAGVTDLVLDLRYNGGGSTLTATRLASMITGQFKDKIFSKEQWNSKINAYFNSENPESLKNYFVDKINNTTLNSLNLSKVYILTTQSSASASELVINGLKPHIQVIQIGTKTYGKNVGSVTLYDSPTFDKKDVNPNHKYAIQPIVVKLVNANDFGDFPTGIEPTFELQEYIDNMGILGEQNEPLLNLAISKITGTSKMTLKEGKSYKYFNDSKAIKNLNEMHLEKAPEGLLRALQ